MKIAAAAFCILVVASAVVSQPKIVTAAQANGTYKSGPNEIRILALGKNRLRIQMDLAWEYKNEYGPGANVGTSSGEGTIENDIATFRPNDTEDCTITIRFISGNRIRVSVEHFLNCGWGFNVNADGTYRKIRGGKPKFDPDR